MISEYQSEFEIYKWKKKDVMCVIESNEALVICANGIDSLNTQKILEQMEPYFTSHHISNVRLEILPGKADVFIHKKSEHLPLSNLKTQE